MNSPSSSSTSASAPAAGALPALLLLFMGSGCAALIYEIVWFQLLQFVIGSSAVSLGVLLGTFMGGMCLGSLLWPRLVSVRWHPLVVYAALELGIAALGVAILFVVPLLDPLYVSLALPGGSGFALRSLVATAILLPPTLLMGATLPAVARWVESTPAGMSWLGMFYAGNIAGAVTGCLLAGFYLLRVYDMPTATYVAAAINVLVAGVALVLSRSLTYIPQSPALRPPQAASSSVSSLSVYLTVFLSGLTALGAEVVWTRLLSLLLGGTVYTFSIILAVFLTGLGIGSSLGAVLAQRTRPQLALGVCQLLLTACIAWSAWQLTSSLPYWPIDPALVKDAWHLFQLDILRSAWAMLPAAALWGASFPLALAAATRPGDDPGRTVGMVYAANTIGAIVGALGFSVVIVAHYGTQRAQQSLIVLAATAAVCALLPAIFGADRNRASDNAVRGSKAAFARAIAGFIVLLLGLAGAYVLARDLAPTPPRLIAYGRYLPHDKGSDIVNYVGEGLNSSIAVTISSDELLSCYFHVAGKVEASSLPADMRLQRMLGHIPALVHPQPKSVLIVGCGAGVTAGSFAVHPSVERIVICEIEPLIPEKVARDYFFRENHGVVTDPRVEIVYDDARHFMLTTKETFDIITSDPIHPWVKGAASLYTLEYFELCKKRLNPGGVVTQWVPLYESSPAVVKSEIATFFAALPEGTVWSNDQGGRGYDTVLLGQLEPLAIDVNKLEQRLSRADHRLVQESLAEVEFRSVFDLLGAYAGRARELEPWLADAEINRDRNLRLQYLAGMSPGQYNEGAILDEMLKYGVYPSDIFTAGPAFTNELKYRIGLPEKKK